MNRQRLGASGRSFPQPQDLCGNLLHFAAGSGYERKGVVDESWNKNHSVQRVVPVKIPTSKVTAAVTPHCLTVICR